MNVSKTRPEEDLPTEEAAASSVDGSQAPAETGSGETPAEGSSPDEHRRAPPEGGSGGPPSLEEQLQAAIAERDANFDRFVRSQAELENYRKRVQKEAGQNRLYQALPLVRDLLPGLDNLHRALESGRQSQNMEELLEGLQMVERQFEDLLAKYSAIPIEAVGQPFDPNRHEAVQQFPSPDHPPMSIIEEVQRGYMLNDRVVRPSKVIVSTGPPQQSEIAADTEEKPLDEQGTSAR